MVTHGKLIVRMLLCVKNGVDCPLGTLMTTAESFLSSDPSHGGNESDLDKLHSLRVFTHRHCSSAVDVFSECQ